MLDEYYRKNYEDENWKIILSKLAKIEGVALEILFYGEDGYSWGYRAYPNGEVDELDRVFVAKKDMETLATQIDDLVCDIENLRFKPEKASEVAKRVKEFMFELAGFP